MCMSPHEMTSVRIERQLKGIQTLVDERESEGNEVGANFWRWKMEQLERVLKDRANDGTYDTAGIP